MKFTHRETIVFMMFCMIQSIFPCFCEAKLWIDSIKNLLIFSEFCIFLPQKKYLSAFKQWGSITRKNYSLKTLYSTSMDSEKKSPIEKLTYPLPRFISQERSG